MFSHNSADGGQHTFSRTEIFRQVQTQSDATRLRPPGHVTAATPSEFCNRFRLNIRIQNNVHIYEYICPSWLHFLKNWSAISWIFFLQRCSYFRRWNPITRWVEMTKRLPPFDSIWASVTSSSTRSHLKTRILNSLTTNKKTNKQTSSQERRRSRLITHGSAWTHCRDRVTPLPAAAYLHNLRTPARQKHAARGTDSISGGAFQTKRP